MSNTPKYEIKSLLNNREWLHKIIDLEIERVKKISDFPQRLHYFFERPEEYDKEGVRKFVKKEGIEEVIEDVLVFLDLTSSYDKESLEKGLREIAKEYGVSFKKVAQPIRLAITGGLESPPLFDILILLRPDSKEAQREAVLRIWLMLVRILYDS